MKRHEERDAAGESLRRLGGILASPSLVTSYGHTTPLRERRWLRRIGLTKEEAAAFLERLCERGALDEGAAASVAAVCRERGVPPAEAARLILRGELRTEKDHT